MSAASIVVAEQAALSEAQAVGTIPTVVTKQQLALAEAQAFASPANWWNAVALNTWATIPGTTYTLNLPRAPYTALGTRGRWGGIQEFGGFAPDRLNSRFLWANAGGGAGAWSGNDVGEWNLKVPGVNMLVAPDDTGSLWPPTVAPIPAAQHVLNQYGRPNSTHVERSLLYSPRTRTLMKFGAGQTWEQDAGVFGNVFEARVEGNIGWEPVTKHPNVPGFGDNLVWCLVDWRNGDMYIAGAYSVYKYNEATKSYVSWLKNPMQKPVGRGAIALLESANKMLLIGQPASGTVPVMWEFDIATGFMTPATLTGPNVSAVTYSRSHGLASDPVGDCLWFFKDDQHLYKLTRTGTATWNVADFPLLGTAPALYGSSIRHGAEGYDSGIWNGFDFFPELGGLAWVSRTDRNVQFVRLYG